MERVYFENKKDFNLYFEKIKENQYKKSWKRIAKDIGTSRSMLEKYRKGKLTIPKNRFFILLNNLNEKDKEYFEKLMKIKKDNWGQIMGGKKAYKINKKAFEKGRNKAIEKIKNNPKYNFNINMPLSKDLTEFIGVIIGDGFTNKYRNLYQTQITGDRRFDSEYYYKALKPICEKLFNISPKITEKDNTIRLNIYSKNLFEMLTKRFNIPAGKKCYKVTIPEEILNSNEEFINYTLRGMFNTDGGIGIDKRKIYKKPYLKINYTSASESLINQMHEILNSYSINHSLNKKLNQNGFVIQINGDKNIKKFMNKIGFSNQRQLAKISYNNQLNI